MSDNVELNAMAGGSVVAADDIGGVKYQKFTLYDVFLALRQILGSIARPIWYRPAENSIQVYINSGTVTTVTTCSTVTTLTQIGGMPIGQGMLDRSNWALNIRNRIT
jgi:hypothetical protein